MRRVPFEPPSWLTPRLIFVVVVIAGAACAAVPSTQFLREVRESPFILTGCSVFLAVLLALWATRPGARSTLWFLLGGPIVGCLNAGLSLALMTAFQGNGSVLGAFLAAALFGSIYGLPLGLLWGGAMFVAWRSVKNLVPLAHDAPDRAAIRLGAWLGAVGCCGALVLRESWPLAGATLGIAMMALGEARLYLRLRWLRRLREGRLDCWIISDQTGDPELQLRPIESAHPLPAGVLVWHSPGPGGPYREGCATLARALVDRREDDASR